MILLIRNNRRGRSWHGGGGTGRVRAIVLEVLDAVFREHGDLGITDGSLPMPWFIHTFTMSFSHQTRSAYLNRPLIRRAVIVIGLRA